MEGRGAEEARKGSLGGGWSWGVRPVETGLRGS